MINIGRICLKTAGRDAGKKCVILDLEKNLVLIDGDVRRRKINVKHIEPTKQVIDIEQNASHEKVVEEFKKLGIELRETKPKKAKDRLKPIRAEQRKKMQPKFEEKPKKEEKKVEKTTTNEPQETKLEKELSKEEK